MNGQQDTIQTTTGQTIGVGIGNACAWLLMEFLAWQYEYRPTDPAVAVVMLGTIFSGLILQVHRIGKAARYVFDRFYPPKEPKDGSSE